MIRPLKNRLVLKQEEADKTTKSGLILAGEKEKPEIAQVISIGREVEDIKEGDRVFYKKYSTTTVKMDDVEYLIIEDKDVLAVLE